MTKKDKEPEKRSVGIVKTEYYTFCILGMHFCYEGFCNSKNGHVCDVIWSVISKAVRIMVYFNDGSMVYSNYSRSF